MNKSYILISFTSSQNQTIINLIDYLNSINIHKSDIYIFTNSNDNILDNLSVKVIRLKKISSLQDLIKQFFSWSNKKTILKAISWADVVHLHEPFIPLFFWRFPVDKRTIISHHASLSILLSLVQKKLIKKERHAHAVTAVSKEASKHVVSSVDVQIVPNAIELTNNSQHFSGGSDILFIGRNEKRKNYQLYEQLSSVAKNKKYNFRAITNQNIHSENISVFVNPDNGIKEGLLKKSSIYLAVNTHGESFGITIVEAINSGCIAICSDIQPFKELLEDSGVYFKNNDLDSLTLAVENITSKDVTNIYLKQLKHIRKYDIDKVITSWISLYSQI